MLSVARARRRTSWKYQQFVSSSRKSDWMIQIKPKWPWPSWVWTTTGDRTISSPQDKSATEKTETLGGCLGERKEEREENSRGSAHCLLLLWFYPGLNHVLVKGLWGPPQPWMQRMQIIPSTISINMWHISLFVCDIWIILGEGLWFKNQIRDICDEDSHLEGDSG